MDNSLYLELLNELKDINTQRHLATSYVSLDKFKINLDSFLPKNDYFNSFSGIEINQRKIRNIYENLQITNTLQPYLDNINYISSFFKDLYPNEKTNISYLKPNSNKSNNSFDSLINEVNESTENYSPNNTEELISKEFSKKVSQYEKEIFEIIEKDHYETGEISNIEYYMSIQSENSLLFIKPATLNILSEHEDDLHIIEGILRIFTSFPYEIMKPECPITCISLFTHKSILVKNKAIQVFEKWNSKESAKQLVNHTCSPSWIQKHLNNVISYLQEYGN